MMLDRFEYFFHPILSYANTVKSGFHSMIMFL